MRTLRQDGEEGAALILALILVTVVSLALLSLGSLVDTGIREASATGTQADRNYAADGAVDAAVNYVRDDFTLGNETPAKNCDYAVPDGTFPNVSGVTVACSPQSGSGGTPPGSSNPNSTPDVAVLATATAETGIRVSGNAGVSGKGLVINGGVQSNSPVAAAAGGSVNVSSGTALTVTAGGLKTLGTCAGGGTYTPACTTGTAAHSDYKTDARWNHDALPTNAVTPVPATVCAAAVPTLGPGVYTNAATLSAITSSGGPCSGKVINFTSGTYLFSFPTGSAEWTMSGAASAAQIHVIGGQLSTTPAVIGSACLSSTSTPVGTDGVEMVFTGESRINNQGAHLELCAKPNATKQQIALYDERAATTTTTTSGSTGVVPPTTTNTSNGASGFVGEAGALTIGDGSKATYATSNNPKNGTMSVSGFSFPTIPAGSTITSVTASVAYQGNTTYMNSLSMSLNSTTPITVSSTAACTASTFCLDGTARTTPVTLPATNFTSADFSSGFTASFTASMKGSPPDGTFSLDGVTITAAYTTTTVTTTGASGCLIATPYTGTGAPCAFVTASGTSAAFSLHGTLYAWDSAVDLSVPNDAVPVFSRGAVARVLKINVPNSFSSLLPIIGLPSGTPGTPADRDVVFVVSINGVRWVRARVKFADSWSNPLMPSNTTADVMSWSTG